jgi:methionyl-tRNA formyltransferase
MLEYKMIVNEDNKVIIITGNKFILRNLRDYQFRNTMIIYDNSSKFNRILRLLRNRKLNTRNIIMMYFAQIDKNSHKRINNQFTRIKSELEFVKIVDSYQPSHIISIHCGIIFHTSLYSQKILMLNIHCASLPQYPGLGAIINAISDKKGVQNVTMHKITNKIDSGEILKTKNFELNLTESYKMNYQKSILAGIELLGEYMTELNLIL